MSASYRAKFKVEHSFLLVKIVNRYFERQHFFSWRHCRCSDGGSVRIKGQKALPVNLRDCFVHVTVASVCVWLVKKLFRLVNQNLSLAAGLAS